MNSYNTKNCEGCKHISDNNHEWCYMFKDAPISLPCGQHDKYAEQRKANGEYIYKSIMKRNTI